MTDTISDKARAAALEAANEACRNMDGELDLDALARHMEQFRDRAITAALQGQEGVREAMEQALLAVAAATRAYLPPDGISAEECVTRILAATDNAKISPIIREIENGRS